MRFLSTRPRTRHPGPSGQPQPVRPSEEDYVCTFCEYTLFYGSEEARKRAIRARRRELRRKQTIKNRAKNVADGKGKGNLGREDDDWDEDEDGDAGTEGCHGRCSYVSQRKALIADVDVRCRVDEPEPKSHLIPTDCTTMITTTIMTRKCVSSLTCNLCYGFLRS